MDIFHLLNRPLGCQDANDIVTLRTCDALAGLGNDVSLLVGHGALDNEAAYGISLSPSLHIKQLPRLDTRLAGIRICANSPFTVAAVLTMLRSSRNRTSVLHTREVRILRWLLPIRRSLGIRVVYDLHELLGVDGPAKKRAWYRKLELVALNSADGIVATTEALACKAREEYGSHLKVDVVPLACTFVHDVPPERSSSPVFRVFYVGQPSVDRGMNELISAAGMVSGCEIHVLGGNPETVRKFRKAASDAGAADKMVFHGFINPSELPAMLADADAFVIPIRAVGRMPYVAHTKVYDCLAGGRPIIASDLPSIREALVHEQNALLVEPGSSRSIADAIERLMSDAELAAGLGSRALADSHKYTYRERASRLCEVFERVLA